MGKQPAFQFYPGDWWREPGLKKVDLSVRGAWAEMLMIMHDENPRGVIQTHLTGIAQMLRISESRAAYIISELDVNHIADVTYFDEDCEKIIHSLADVFIGLEGDMSPKCPVVSRDFPPLNTVFVTIENRRIIKEEKQREYDRLKKQHQRHKDNVPPDVPSDVPKKSPLYSSSSSSKERKKKEISPSFPNQKTLTLEAKTCFDKCRGNCRSSWEIAPTFEAVKNVPSKACHWCQKFDKPRTAKP